MKRKIKRTIDFRYRLICYYCATGEIVYQSQYSNVHEEKIKDEDEWIDSLTVWGDKMRGGLIEFLERAARQKCKKYGRAGTICWKYDIEEPGFQFGEEVVLVPVIEVPPRDVLMRIERIEELIKEVETIDERMALEEELRKLKDRYGIT